MNLTVDKLLKGVAGAIILIVLLVTVTRWWGDYRVAAVKASVPDATTTATPTAPAQTEGEGSQEAAAPAIEEPQTQASQETAPSGQTVVVLIEGLNFRKEADRGSKAIRALSKGEKLVLVSKIDSWYQVKDTDGEIGWISSNPAYAELEK